ncbi:MAG: hypothetical protein HOV81_09550 [Kofleriaceae bacterium]|nr:hypothetical protein [Kofleriaceae bacterium]
MRLALSLVLVAGCSFGEDHPVMKTVQSAGRVCLLGTTTAQGQLYAANASVTVRYETPGCLSQSCDRDRMASCEVNVIDGALNISSFASWNDYSLAGGACTDDCGRIAAQCETGPLAEYAYPILFGSTPGGSLAVPSTLAEPLCIEVQ